MKLFNNAVGDKSTALYNSLKNNKWKGERDNLDSFIYFSKGWPTTYYLPSTMPFQIQITNCDHF